MNPKFKKLIRDPNLFFKDMYFKNMIKIRQHIPIKSVGHHQYTIISATYNVGRYLDDYFKSITTQNLDFKKHIQIICVDDGSTDNSAVIIKEWQQKYPNNIHYFYQENEGQSSARNLGLQHATTEWVTFIDPDDFLHPDYFRVVDNNIFQTPNTEMVVCNLIFFIENEKKFKDTHSLKYRFKETKSVFGMDDLKQNMSLSASSTFFRLQNILNSKLLFDGRIKPNFEDGKFIGDYSLNHRDGKALFLKDAKYFYRKRSDGTSTLDNSWTTPQKFKDVLEYGYIPFLKDSKDALGFVPYHTQRTILYDVVWYVKHLMNQSGKAAFLSQNQKEVFFSLLKEIFTYIDSKTILEFDLGAWFLHKVALLGCLKGEAPPFQIVYIENVDKEKKQLLLSYFTYNLVNEEIQINNQDIIPSYTKSTCNTFVDQHLVYERRLWIPYDDTEQLLKVFINNKPARITLAGKQHNNGLKIGTIVKNFTPSIDFTPSRDNAWRIMDRDVQADDNGEHFYRYMLNNHPEQICYFALSHQSHDWDRLAAEGFNLIEFGSKQYEERLKKVSKIISSHLDEYIDNYFDNDYEYGKKFVFLQHGVTQQDLTSWFNSKKNIQCLCTTTLAEYHSIADDKTHYKLSNKEVILTGFARHDKLLKQNKKDTKRLIIMPTWRRSIVGNIRTVGNSREFNVDFMKTNYAIHWHSLLNSPILKMLATEYGYEIIFAPHANIEQYLEAFTIPSYIKTWKASHGNIQGLFQSAKFMITDYSSVAFEMAYLNKQVLYYQFDHDEIFLGGHIIKEGYFKYEIHGFGPVAYNEASLIEELEKVLKNDGYPIEPYTSRIEETFAFRDTNNCERIYNAILNLDVWEPNNIDLEILTNAIKSAYLSANWRLVKSRSQLLLNNAEPFNIEQYQWGYAYLCEALFELGEYTELNAILNDQGTPSSLVSIWSARLLMLNMEWPKAITLFNQVAELSIYENLDLMHCHAKLKDFKNTRAIAHGLEKQSLTFLEQQMVAAWLSAAEGNWDSTISILNLALENTNDFSTQELRTLKPQLLLSYAYKNIGNLDSTNLCLVQYEKHAKHDPVADVMIATFAFDSGNYKKSIFKFDSIFKGQYTYLSGDLLATYINALIQNQNFYQAREVLNNILSAIPDNHQSNILLMQLYSAQNNWEEVLNISTHLTQTDSEAIKLVMEAHYRTGDIEKAYRIMLKPHQKYNLSYWQLAMEIALLQEDYDLAEYCCKGIIAYYPNDSTTEAWFHLYNIRSRKLNLVQ